MKKILLWIFFGMTIGAHAQDSIRYRIIFIGDAGEINPEQSTVIPAAADHILPGKTTVVYVLGDNVYPRGMGLPRKRRRRADPGRSCNLSLCRCVARERQILFYLPGNARLGPDGENWG